MANYGEEESHDDWPNPLSTGLQQYQYDYGLLDYGDQT